MTSSKSFFATLILVGTLAVCNVGGCIIAAAGLIIAAIAIANRGSGPKPVSG